MNVESNISIEDVLLNRKYLTNKVKKFGFDNLEHAQNCKNLVEILDTFACISTDPIDLESDDCVMAKEEIMPIFSVFMRTIAETDECKRIGNRLSKSKSKKNQKIVKQPKIDEATLFQLSGFALQLGAQRNETVSIDQALKFLLDHAVKTIHFSKV